MRTTTECHTCHGGTGQPHPCICAVKATVSPDSNVEKNREMLLQRSIVGLAKYGVTTDNNPLTLRAWLVHALEEALDMANYLQAAITEIDRSSEHGEGKPD